MPGCLCPPRAAELGCASKQQLRHKAGCCCQLSKAAASPTRHPLDRQQPDKTTRTLGARRLDRASTRLQPHVWSSEEESPQLGNAPRWESLGPGPGSRISSRRMFQPAPILIAGLWSLGANRMIGRTVELLGTEIQKWKLMKCFGDCTLGRIRWDGITNKWEGHNI